VSGDEVAAEPAGPAVPEPRNRSGCDRCTTARCCVRFDPELTGLDVVRLVAVTGLAPRAFARLRPAHAGQAGEDGVRLGPGPEAWLVCLASAGPPRDGGRACVFLAAGEGGVPRCGVYAGRPLRCRTFPTELAPWGVEVETPEAICPPGAWTREGTDLEGTRRVHLRAWVELAVMRAFLGHWNAAAKAAIGLSRSEVEEIFWERLVAVHQAVARELGGRLGDAGLTPAAAVEAVAEALAAAGAELRLS